MKQKELTNIIIVTLIVFLIATIIFSFIKLKSNQERIIEQNDSIKQELIYLNDYLYD